MFDTQPDLNLIIASFISYLIGSIPFAVIIGRFAGIGDIRAYGSGNPGATNMTKVAGKKWGAITLLLDAGKGVVAVFIARELGYATSGALFVILGHCFSIFLKLRGGKGVATTLGALLTLSPPTGFAFIIIWLIVFAVFRISSLSALVAVNTLIVVSAILWYGNIFFLVSFLAVLITIRHSSNIKRLVRGEEK